MADFEEELRVIREAGLLRSLRTLTSPQGPTIEMEGRRVLNFCSNDYLGLADDPRLKKAAIEAVERFGSGSGAARLISGHNELIEKLERELALLKGAASALVFNSGYHANIGVIPALAGTGDLIFSDALNHASLIDGCRLSKAKTVVYRHNDLNHLEALLKDTPLPSRERVAVGRVRVIITEAVFSMEGDLCPLKDLLSLAERYDALIYLDEAHAVGVFGNGEGVLHHPPERVICMGTLGKAFGSYGAFVAGSKTMRDYWINKARSFIFSTALPPAAVGAALAATNIIRTEPERRQRLWKNIRQVRDHPSPILSIPIGPADKTMELSKQLLEMGIYVQGIRPPTVPEGTSRLRLTLTSAHTTAQIETLLGALKQLQTPS